MNTMNMPGFTAEATLYNSVSSYRSSFLSQTDIALNVTPQLSEVFDPYRPIFCLKTVYEDIAPAGYPPHLVRRLKLGFWNEVTGRCE
jgi:hypothetical protein